MNTKNCEWCGKQIEVSKPSYAKKCQLCCMITSPAQAYELGYERGFNEGAKKPKLNLADIIGLEGEKK